MDTSERIQRLIKSCKEAIEDFQPEGETTFCNLGANYICKEIGFKDFNGLTANQMVARMKNAPDFALVLSDIAQSLANDGRMVIAGIQADPHGHIALCYPGKVMFSGKWQENAPMICNIGKRNGIMSANYGFLEKPKYYAYIEGTA